MAAGPNAVMRGRFAAAAAGILDAVYLAGWLLSPVAAWAPWAIVAGLALGGWALGRHLRAGHPLAWPRYPAALLLPASSALAAHRGARDPHPAPPAPGTRRDVHARAGVVVLLAALAVIAASGALDHRLADPLLAPVDERAGAYVDRALLQAGGAYIGTRVLDRLFAVAADIQIDLILIQGKPGQIFDPLRDLLDRFSTVILVAIASLTLQKVLLELTGDLAVAVLGAAAAATFALAVLLGRERWTRPLAACAGLLLGTALFLRLLLPLAGVGVAAISEHALAERQDRALATVEDAAGRVGMELDLRGPRAAEGDAPLSESVDELQQSARRLGDVDESWLRSLFDAFIDLTAVFVIETLVAPLLVLLLLWALARRLAGLARPARRGQPE